MTEQSAKPKPAQPQVIHKPWTESVVGKLMSAVPRWALGIMGTMLTFTLMLQVMGIDFSGPINDLSAAYVKAAEIKAVDVSENQEFRETVILILEEQREFMIGSISDINRTVHQNADAIERLEKSISLLDRTLALLEKRLTTLETSRN